MRVTQVWNVNDNINDAFNTNTISVDHAINISNELDIPLLYISTAKFFDEIKMIITIGISQILFQFMRNQISIFRRKCI